MAEQIINKIAESGLVTLDLEQFYPDERITIFDLKPFLFMELILKEKDFRLKLINTDWSIYQNHIVGVFCSADAVIPVWGYMLVATYLQPVAKEVILGNEDAVIRQLMTQQIQAIDATAYHDKRVVVKGCGDKAVREFAYLEITKNSVQLLKSIMYGEPCSTVPVFKSRI